MTIAWTLTDETINTIAAGSTMETIDIGTIIDIYRQKQQHQQQKQQQQQNHYKNINL